MGNKKEQISVQEYANRFKRAWCESRRGKNDGDSVSRQAVLARIKSGKELPNITEIKKVGKAYILTWED